MVVKDVGGSFDAFGFAFLRFAVAAAAFSPFLKVRTGWRAACAGTRLVAVLQAAAAAPAWCCCPAAHHPSLHPHSLCPPPLQASGKDSRILKAGVEIGAWTAMGYIFQSAGLLTTDASRASFLSTFTVLVGGSFFCNLPGS